MDDTPGIHARGCSEGTHVCPRRWMTSTPSHSKSENTRNKSSLYQGYTGEKKRERERKRRCNKARFAMYPFIARLFLTSNFEIWDMLKDISLLFHALQFHRACMYTSQRNKNTMFYLSTRLREPWVINYGKWLSQLLWMERALGIECIYSGSALELKVLASECNYFISTFMRELRPVTLPVISRRFTTLPLSSMRLWHCGWWSLNVF